MPHLKNYLAVIALFGSAVLALPADSVEPGKSAAKQEAAKEQPKQVDSTPKAEAGVSSGGFVPEYQVDYVSKKTSVAGFVNGTSIKGACGVNYHAWSHGVCVSPDFKDACGHDVYAYRGADAYKGTPPKPAQFETVGIVVDVCQGLSRYDVKFTLDGYEEVGGGPRKFIEDDVFWKISDGPRGPLHKSGNVKSDQASASAPGQPLAPADLPAKQAKGLSKRTISAGDVIAAGNVIAAGIILTVEVANPILEFAQKAIDLRKRDKTSAWSSVFGNYDGRTVKGACGIEYGLHDVVACVSPRQVEHCGHWIYAYRGDGKEPEHKATMQAVDICDRLPNEQIDVSWAAFKLLGGTLKDKKIPKVNYKYLEQKPDNTSVKATNPQGSAAQGPANAPLPLPRDAAAGSASPAGSNPGHQAAGASEGAKKSDSASAAPAKEPNAAAAAQPQDAKAAAQPQDAKAGEPVKDSKAAEPVKDSKAAEPAEESRGDKPAQNPEAPAKEAKKPEPAKDAKAPEPAKQGS